MPSEGIIACCRFCDGFAVEGFKVEVVGAILVPEYEESLNKRLCNLEKESQPFDLLAEYGMSIARGKSSCNQEKALVKCCTLLTQIGLYDMLPNCLSPPNSLSPPPFYRLAAIGNSSHSVPLSRNTGRANPTPPFFGNPDWSSQVLEALSGLTVLDRLLSNRACFKAFCGKDSAVQTLIETMKRHVFSDNLLSVGRTCDCTFPSPCPLAGEITCEIVHRSVRTVWLDFALVSCGMLVSNSSNPRMTTPWRQSRKPESCPANCACLYVRVCLRVRVCVCVHVCVFVYAYVYIRVCLSLSLHLRFSLYDGRAVFFFLTRCYLTSPPASKPSSKFWRWCGKMNLAPCQHIFCWKSSNVLCIAAASAPTRNCDFTWFGVIELSPPGFGVHPCGPP